MSSVSVSGSEVFGFRGSLSRHSSILQAPSSIHYRRTLTTSTTSNSLPRYHIEASNAEFKDATVLTVRGPDVDGILASMTVALAVKGCSLMQLHAAVDADVSHDRNNHTHSSSSNEVELIKDIFYVVDRATGQPFPDDQLQELALALLEATQAPLNVLSMKGAVDELEKLDHHEIPMTLDPEQQITIVPSSEATDIDEE